MDPFTIMLVAAAIGAGTGGASSYLGFRSQARAARKQAKLTGILKNQFQSSLASDPLVELALGRSDALAQGAESFDPRKAFRLASSQINAGVRRRQTDISQQLAAMGFGGNTDQTRFLAGQLDRSRLRAMGQAQQFIDTQAIPQAQAFQGALGAHLQGLLGLKGQQIGAL